MPSAEDAPLLLRRPFVSRNDFPGPVESIRAEKGSALVVVLCLLVLMLGVTLAFFSRAQQAREISSSSAASLKADLLATAAIGIIEADFIKEIEAGSAKDEVAPTLSGTVRKVLIPVVTASNTYPSMMPRRVVSGTSAPLNIVKQSLSGRRFFESGSSNGYRNDADPGPARASSISTTTPALRGSRLLPKTWEKPQLMTETEAASFTSPDWIYLDRSGGNPTEFTEATMALLSDRKSDNSSYVIGRFAYVIYDVGGLLDINIVGNPPGTDENGRRGRLHQVTIPSGTASSGTGGLVVPDFTKFVEWRTGADTTAPDASGGVFDPKRTFLDVPHGSQAFVSRQDLIRYAEKGSPLSLSALPYLTTFSRDVNAPMFQPIQPSTIPADLEAPLLNPDPLAVRFLTPTELTRGTDRNVKVPAGTPVMARRFPLNKLDLLSQAAPDPESLLYYFGLSRVGAGVFEYKQALGTRIARLSEIRDAGREPNFFEVLQSTILTGSLGKHGGNTYSLDDSRDANRNLQVVQIAANIIDQWDTDDIPTVLRYPSGIAGEYIEVYGVENLPYISSVNLVALRPQYNRDKFQVWAMFDVWNPHQNALIPPNGITKFRIRAKSGRVRPSIRYYVKRPDNSNNPFQGLYTSTDIVKNDIYRSVPDLNKDYELTFDVNPGTEGYSKPTIVGSDAAPTSTQSVPGILMADVPFVPVAIPAKASRTANLQRQLNILVFTSTGTGFTSSGGPIYAEEQPCAADGSWWFPEGTTFNNLSPNWTHVTGESLTPGGDKVEKVYANFGVKAHNSYRITPEAGFEPEIELQALVDNVWRTYQTVYGFPAAATFTTHQTAEENPTSFLKHTVYDLADAVQKKDSFYDWRLANAGQSGIKIDPRSIRFGHSGGGAAGTLGTTIRQSTAPWDGIINGPANEVARWRMFTNTVVGRKSEDEPVIDYKFEWFNQTKSIVLPYGFIANIPASEAAINNTTNPARYSDRDMVIRPGDGYLGAMPTVEGRFSERPLILNRPFRSVGELGYVFRDLPWKTLDFFSRQSADLGLLDVFSLEDTEAATPVLAGHVNLNTPHATVLGSLLLDTANGINDISTTLPSPNIPPGKLTAAQAGELAAAIVEESKKSPLHLRGDLVSRILAPNTRLTPEIKTGGVWKPTTKATREAAIRTLSELGTTRVWNLMIDLVVQSGHFPPSVKTGDQFLVRGHRRYWVHLAIDRITGEVIDRQVEALNE